MRMRPNEDYLDEELAYLLGAIVARGEIFEERDMTTILIAYPFKNLIAEGLTKSYNAPDKLSLGLDGIVNLASNLGFNVTKQSSETECRLVIKVMTESLPMRVLKSHLSPGRSYREFHVPEAIFNSKESIQREFVRGYVDVAGHVRKSNNYIDGRHRVYIDVLNENWHLPVELCTLLQDHLRVPVQTITWGHPNIRDPNLSDYNAGRQRSWAREHQIKVFADVFMRVGFYISYKGEILEELGDYNKKNFPKRSAEFCPGPKRITDKKPQHPGENDPQLPDRIRGKHFDSYWQICEVMGCPKFRGRVKLFKWLMW